MRSYCFCCNPSREDLLLSRSAVNDLYTNVLGHFPKLTGGRLRMSGPASKVDPGSPQAGGRNTSADISVRFWCNPLGWRLSAEATPSTPPIVLRPPRVLLGYFITPSMANLPSVLGLQGHHFLDKPVTIPRHRTNRRSNNNTVARCDSLGV
jgi:hypothetical protein